METKDWILLLVPIASNGIIIYIIQVVFQSYNRKNTDLYERKKTIKRAFFELLLDSKSFYRAFGYAITDTPNDNEKTFFTLGEFNRSIRKILDYYDDHAYFLKEYMTKITELRGYYDEYIEKFKVKEALDNEDRKLFAKNIHSLNIYVVELIDASQKNA